MKNKEQMLYPLQGIRFLAFLGVFISHIGIIDWGEWGVSVFLILSGFLMQYRHSNLQLNTPGRIRYAIDKIKKQYPLHIVTMIVAIIAQALAGMIFYSFKRSIIDCGIIGLHLFLLQAWIPRSGVYFSLNGVSWYLCVILFCYLIFPLIAAKIRKYSSIKDAAKQMLMVYTIQIAAAYISTFAHVPAWLSKDFTTWFTYVCPLFRLGDFAIGCNLGYIFQNKCSGKKTHGESMLYLCGITVLELIFLMAGLLIPESLAKESGLAWSATSIIYLPVSVGLVYLFARGTGYLSKVLSTSPFVTLGGLTTYGYLIHFQVVNNWQRYFRFSKYIDAIVCLLITMGMAWLWMKAATKWSWRL